MPSRWMPKAAALCAARGLRGFDAAYCFGSYEGTLRELIHLYKYGRIKTLIAPLADLLAAALPLDERFDAVTPVPLHWRKQWQRGFNQSELLARDIARRRGIPVVRALRRVRSTRRRPASATPTAARMWPRVSLPAGRADAGWQARSC